MTKPLRLIFMGTPEFSIPALSALLEAGHHIVAVYTQPPRPAGRGQKDTLVPVHHYALSKNLSVCTPISLREPEAQKHFAEHNADAAVVAAYGLLLPKQILSATRMGCINVHPSLLPRWRGAAPIQRTVMAGDTKTGVVIMQMNAGLDTGDMLMTQQVDIADGTTAGELHDLLSAMAAPMVVETLGGLARGSVTPIAQPEDGVTYAHKITKEECRIVWSEQAAAVRQKILGLSPAPGAYFIYKEEKIKILRADMHLSAVPAAPGTVLDGHLTIACAQGAVRPTLLHRAGKKVMTAADFLKGFSIPPGTALE